MKSLIRILVIAIAALTGSATAAAAPEPAAAAATVSVRGGGVDIANPAEHPVAVEVYAITGALVLRTDAPEGTSRIDLAAGCYIVRVDGLSSRVAIR